MCKLVLSSVLRLNGRPYINHSNNKQPSIQIKSSGGNLVKDTLSLSVAKVKSGNFADMIYRHFYSIGGGWKS